MTAQYDCPDKHTGREKFTNWQLDESKRYRVGRYQVSEVEN